MGSTESAPQTPRLPHPRRHQPKGLHSTGGSHKAIHSTSIPALRGDKPSLGQKPPLGHGFHPSYRLEKPQAHILPRRRKGSRSQPMSHQPVFAAHLIYEGHPGGDAPQVSRDKRF